MYPVSSHSSSSTRRSQSPAAVCAAVPMRPFRGWNGRCRAVAGLMTRVLVFMMAFAVTAAPASAHPGPYSADLPDGAPGVTLAWTTLGLPRQLSFSRTEYQPGIRYPTADRAERGTAARNDPSACQYRRGIPRDRRPSWRFPRDGEPAAFRSPDDDAARCRHLGSARRRLRDQFVLHTATVRSPPARSAARRRN